MTHENNAVLFEQLGLINPILKALHRQDYDRPTDIQKQAIPEALAGQDLLAIAQTGTGKTAAFSLPMLQLLGGRRTAGAIRGLVLAPTRELALQVHDSLVTYGQHMRLTAAVILGGVSSGKQISALKRKPDILVATPGRLLDLLGQGYVKLDKVEMLVLDEADRMLDMGFIHDVRRIVNKVPTDRQTLFFSATMPPEVAELADTMLYEPVRVEVTPTASVSNRIEQHVLFVERVDKQKLLAHVIKRDAAFKALVFTRTKHRANRVAKLLTRDGIVADAIHSNKTQSARQRALASFASNKLQVLVATDIVARGIDVDAITHVFNFDLPDEPESHVHRIGRTARAGADGLAYSFCDDEEIGKLQDIEKTIDLKLTKELDHPYHSEAIYVNYQSGANRGKGRGSSRSSGRKRGGGRGGANRSSGGGERRSSAGAQGGRKAAQRRPSRWQVSEDAFAEGIQKTESDSSKGRRKKNRLGKNERTAGKTAAKSSNSAEARRQAKKSRRSSAVSRDDIPESLRPMLAASRSAGEGRSRTNAGAGGRRKKSGGAKKSSSRRRRPNSDRT